MQSLPDWPLFGFADDQRPALAKARGSGQPCVLATIAALDGGGPRPIGSQMVVAEDFVSGYLSGGCVEGDVAAHAAGCLADGAPRRLVYGQGSPWPDIRLLCGARIEILLERIDPTDTAVGNLLDLRQRRRPAVWISDGERRVCGETARPWSGVLTLAFEPVWRMVVLGTDPVALAAASLAAQSGYETTLVRPRGPAEPPPFETVAYRRDDPREALAAIGLDPWTAVAICMHDMDLDEQALLAALPSKAPYVGLLGARRRLPDRMARLKAAGLTDRDFAKLRAPIGLDLGGKSPWDIAIAILGEVTAVRAMNTIVPAPETLNR